MRAGRRECAVSLALVLACAVAASAQERKPTPEEMARVQAAMVDAMRPGTEHERLARLTGEWDQEVRIWSSPEAEPAISRGRVENRMILGGRFLVSEGTAGEGEWQVGSMTILGFDRRHGLYTAAGYDTWGTYHVSAQGSWNAERGAIVMNGSDVVTEDHTQTWEFVLRETDSNAYTWEVIFTDPVHAPDGVPFRMVEITYRRRS
jgi:hypothetical protein